MRNEERNQSHRNKILTKNEGVKLEDHVRNVQMREELITKSIMGYIKKDNSAGGGI